MNKLIIFRNSNGSVDVYERIEDSPFDRVTYTRRNFETIGASPRKSGASGLLLALSAWLLRDSAVSTYHWLLGMLLSD